APAPPARPPRRRWTPPGAGSRTRPPAWSRSACGSWDRRRRSGSSSSRVARPQLGERLVRDRLEGGDHVGVELRARGDADLLAGGGDAGAGAVRPVGRERGERAGDREPAGGERDLLAGQPVRVAVAVPALVVVADDELAFAEEVDVAQDLRADHRVLGDQRELV